ncbi:MAG: hypothetical protein BroJett021_01960 [Chloroflexota bacterium]|nr:MAG: hypothetical protein BroJett021_01960 [Chloroflexota bacterium]
MVRKQVYIYPHQEARLKAMAAAQLMSEADLIRQAVDAFLGQPHPPTSNSLPPDEAAWQEVLASFAAVRERSLPGAPHRWTREDYYDEQR